MRLSRSAVYTMLQTRAQKDRVITSLPPPFIRQASPHTHDDFHEEVRNAAIGDHMLQAGLKISKMIVLGDVATGKTCLVNRFCHQVFDANYKATIGVDFEVERFDILGIPFNLQIWDTAGQERFKCIAASYYRGASDKDDQHPFPVRENGTSLPYTSQDCMLLLHHPCCSQNKKKG